MLVEERQTSSTHPIVDELASIINSNNPSTLFAFQREAEREAALFQEGAHSLITEYISAVGSSSAFDAWCETSIGRQFAADLVGNAIELLSRTVHQGMPGHDRRHIMYKVPLAALRFCLSENLSVAESLFLAPVLLHDVGRLPEPVMFDKPGAGTKGGNHAIFGFLVIKKLFDAISSEYHLAPDIARGLKCHGMRLARAVLVHQKGECRDDYYARVVQDMDRLQLLGVEIVGRSLGSDVGIHQLSLTSPIDKKLNTALPRPGSVDSRSYRELIEFYMRVLGDWREPALLKTAETSKVDSAIFLMLSGDRNQVEQTFFPEHCRDAGVPFKKSRSKRALSAAIWKKIQRTVDPAFLQQVKEISKHHSLTDLAVQVAFPTLTTRDSAIEGTIIGQAKALNEAEARRLKEAFAFAVLRQRETDLIDLDTIVTALWKFRRSPERPEFKVARLMGEYLTGKVFTEYGDSRFSNNKESM